jgi:hypothetical protein
MKMRLASVLATVLLLAALLVMATNAEVESRLVAVSYEGWEQLQELASWGLQIIHYQGEVLAALSHDEQIAQLRHAGFQVHVLDLAADPKVYYLAYPFPVADLAALSEVEAAYPYGKDAYIVKATPAQAETLAMHGVEIVKLPHSIVLPSPQPMLAGAQASLAYQPAVQTMVDAVSPTLLIHHVCTLQDSDTLTYCNELGTRYSHATAELDEAAQYIYSEYAALGLSVAYDPFVYSTPMTNVVAELPGVGPGSDRIYILCAHYDSLSNVPYSIAPGADDNASGSAAVLEAARILSQYQFSHTLRFIHFAGEEQGMFGSVHYAAEAYQREDLIDGVINLDMIGYESVPPNDHIVEVHAGTNPASIALADALIDNAAEYSLHLAPQRITVGATSRSDHASFWNYGYAAILGIEDLQDFNPYYHSADDTLANMQTDMMVEYTKAAVATLAELALWQNRTPELGTVVPASGSSAAEQTQYFTTTWSDPDGWQDLKQCYFHIGASPGLANNVTLLYNAQTDKLWIRSDDGMTWSGGFAPGSVSATLENTQAQVDCEQTTVQPSGSTIEVRWAISFKPTFTGAKKTGLKCRDAGGARAKGQWKGAWTVN